MTNQLVRASVKYSFIGELQQYPFLTLIILYKKGNLFKFVSVDHHKNDKSADRSIGMSLYLNFVQSGQVRSHRELYPLRHQKRAKTLKKQDNIVF